MEVVMDSEEKDLWHAFLQKGNYTMAARYANGQVLHSREPYYTCPEHGL